GAMASLARILVVEDNDDIRESVVGLLREQGYEVIEAENGERGLELLRSTRDVDLVVLDLRMPVMNGATFCWQQRSDKAIASIPVLILSSVVDGRKSAELLGAAAHLLKPFEPAALLEAVERAASTRKKPKR
ncbi:MAG: response regulator receiver protein, partial [Myxococcaceae bacterium]|nr:response regulator receiver protein [Myxococcaceae bacterium]